jgi:PAT family beta-lactamase induction signal transducer AmpG
VDRLAELLIGSAFALVALTLPTSNFFQLSLAVFWLLAFSAATHDIASDGFYMLGLQQHEQAAYVGIRSTFFRLSMITGQGGLVYLAGKLTEMTGNVGGVVHRVLPARRDVHLAVPLA